MNFREIAFGSEQYRSACALRETVLRAPLGFALSAHDVAGEAGQLHFGLFGGGNELLACVTARPVGGGEVRIRQTAVAPQHQRQGLARSMMRELEAVLAARGYSVLSLHARASAVGFYERIGFEAVGESFVEVTIPHRKMIKRLP